MHPGIVDLRAVCHVCCALAQQGAVVHELYKDHTWTYDTRWPKLGDDDCGTSIGCSCGGSERDVGDEEESGE